MPHAEAFFLSLDGQSRFCLLHRPAQTLVHGAIVFVHPFAEEMNRCRRMAALQARAFAQAGWLVFQMDLYGCGDSSGEFGEASWLRWIDDIAAALRCAESETGARPLLWSARAGCLLAARVAQMLEPAPGLLLWQPSLSGKQVLQQFLRFQVANQMLATREGERRGTQQLRERLVNGECVEVAGYVLAPDLALGLEATDLQLPAPPARVAWFELASEPGAELAPASRVRIEAWRSAGHRIDTRVVHGVAFWQTVENSECPELINATTEVANAWRK